MGLIGVHMKSRKWRILIGILLIALTISAIKVAPIIRTGYQMYHDALADTPLDVRVEMIRREIGRAHV